MFALFRRFSRCMAIAITAAALATPALALDTVKFMAPGSVGGGYDQTARELGKAMIEAKVAKSVTFENKGGAGGTLGLAQFANSTKGRSECVAGGRGDHGRRHRTEQTANHLEGRDADCPAVYRIQRDCRAQGVRIQNP